MASTEIPDIVIGRLPIYLRALSVMAAAGQEITSSHELGEKLGISSAQIRKDLSHFGEFGKQGNHTLVLKIKPCMSEYKHLYSETANGSINQL